MKTFDLKDRKFVPLHTPTQIPVSVCFAFELDEPTQNFKDRVIKLLDQISQDKAQQ